MVQAGMKLNQLRFGRGRRDVVGEEMLRQLGKSDSLIDADEDIGPPNINRGYG